MKVPLRWLEEFVDLPTADPGEISDALDAIGDKVEGYEVLEADWSDVVVGRVVEEPAGPGSVHLPRVAHIVGHEVHLVLEEGQPRRMVELDGSAHDLTGFH